jgi:hypothetical protein
MAFIIAKTGECLSASLSWHLGHHNVLQCTRVLLGGLRRSKIRDVHARCTLRKRKGLGSDISLAEISEWTRQYQLGNVKPQHGAIHHAFDSGEEVRQSCTNLGLLGSPGLHRNITLKW